MAIIFSASSSAVVRIIIRLFLDINNGDYDFLNNVVIGWLSIPLFSVLCVGWVNEAFIT